MTTTEKILLIDDDPVQRMLAASALADRYEVIECDNGADGLVMASKEAPVLILLDINMPGMDGFETCRRLHAETDRSNMPVLFLSGEVTKEDRLHAYEAGGEDFIAKPFDPDELLVKVSVTLKALHERSRLSDEARSAFQTAMTAMSSASEMGIVIQTLRKSASAQTVGELADALLGGCHAYGLDACVQMRSGTGVVSRNMTGDSSPIEQGVLSNMAETGRIFSLGRRSVYNYGQITLMIKDMPKDDQERYGRLRDNLALLAEGFDTRLYALDVEMAIDAQRDVLENVLVKSFAALQTIDERHAKQRAEAQFVLTSMLQKVEVKFYSLGLTESQEEAVSNLVRDAAHKVFDLYDEGLDVGAHLARIRAQIHMLPPPRQKKPVEASEGEAQAASQSSDADLF